MKKILISENEELKGLIHNIHRNDQIRFFAFGIFLLSGLLLRWMGIEVPWITIEIIALLLFINVLCECLAKKIWAKQTIGQANLGYFIIQLVEITVLLTAIRFFETVLSWGIAVLIVYVVFCYLTFTKRIYSRIIALISVIGYIVLGLLEHFGIFCYIDLYNLGIDPNKNQPFFIVTTSLMIGFFICLVLYIDVFSKKLRDSIKTLRDKISQLTKREEELSGAKTTLEIKVEAKTKKSKELAKRAEMLDEQLKQRTEELQQKTKELQKIEELERFHKLVVGRELKMIELKKEIKKLKKLPKTKRK